jgi:hypothetical protein
MSAVEQIGRAALPREWTGKEFALCADDMAKNPTNPAIEWLQPRFYPAVWFWLGGRRPLIDPVEPSPEQWQQAYDRWAWFFEHANDLWRRKELICIAVRKLAEKGELTFYARDDDTGEMVLVPSARWNCDPDISLARLATGRINLERPMAAVPADYAEQERYLAQHRSWLFVPKENLAAVVASFASPASEGREGGPEDLPAVGASSLAEDDEPGEGAATNKKPFWYPMLVDLYEAADKRQADFMLKHPDKSPPLFPKAPWFRNKLLARKVEEDQVRPSTVR